MLGNFYNLAYLALVATICSVYGQANLNIKAKAEPYSLPYGPYHCYLRIVASCYNETKVNTGRSFEDPGLCVNVMKTSYFHMSPPINCDHDDFECWKTCNGTFKSDQINKGTGFNLSSPILNNVTYASHETEFDPTVLNMTWSPVKGADLYVIQYLNPVDTYSNWEVGSGRPIITSKTYTIFKKDNLCSKFMFRVAAISPSHVGQFSNIMESPDEYPPGVYLKLNLAEMTYKNHSTNFKMDEDEDFRKKIGIKLSYNMPVPQWVDDMAPREKAYIRTKDDAYLELKKQMLFSNKFFVNYLFPMEFLNSGNELLFVLETFRDACKREVKANTALKIRFTCDNNAKSQPCNHRAYVDIMEKQDPWMAKMYKSRQLIKLEEPQETGGATVLKKFRQEINMDNYMDICDIEIPSTEPDKVVILNNYQSVLYCGTPPPTVGAIPLIVDTDYSIDNKDENGSIDFMVTSKVYTINIDKASLALLLKIAIVFLCVIIASALAGISYSHFKRRSFKDDHVILKDKVDLP